MQDVYQLGLVQRIQSGDSSAEEELFFKYKDPVLWKVRKHIQTDKEELKDLVSDIYLAILEGLRKECFQPEKWESLDHFIWGVTNNKIKDWLKKVNRQRRTFDPDPPSENIAKLTEEYLLENQELQNTLRMLLKALPAKYQSVLILYYFDELSIEEISEQINLPARRVSERIHYAKELIRKSYNKKRNLSILGVIILFYLCNVWIE